MSQRVLLLTFLLAAGPPGIAARAATDTEVPRDAPNDAVMASPSEVAETTHWVSQAFAGAKRSDRVRCVDLEVRRQDHNVLRFGQSCMETPIRIGRRQFDHGLGTHANSEIVVDVPSGAKAFRARVGIDNNYNTQGIRGSVRFVVEIGGKEVLHTPTLRGSDDPAPVDIEIPGEMPEDAHQLVLKVDTTTDGPAHDQADWADAHFLMGDGSRLWLDENQSELLFLSADPPFSFVYDGTPSAELLPTWRHACQTKELDDRLEYRAQWTDPKTSLCVSAVASVFKRPISSTAPTSTPGWCWPSGEASVGISDSCWGFRQSIPA